MRDPQTWVVELSIGGGASRRLGVVEAPSLAAASRVAVAWAAQVETDINQASDEFVLVTVRDVNPAVFVSLA